MGLLKFDVRYRAHVERSDATGVFVSRCPMLEIISQGRTEDEAKAALRDSVQLFVIHCFRKGILDEVLRKRGLEPDESDPSSFGGLANEASEAEGVRVSTFPDAVAYDDCVGIPMHRMTSRSVPPPALSV